MATEEPKPNERPGNGTEKVFKLVAYLAILFVVITVLVLLCILFVKQRTQRGESLRPCYCTGTTGGTISTSSSPHHHHGLNNNLGATCDKQQICFTGPTGPAGAAGFTGGQGATGQTGHRGSDLIVNAYGNLNEAVISTIESSIFYPETYLYVVEQDNRVNINQPAGIAGDMSLHLIYYDGQGHWEDWGPFTGLPGEMGPAGADGVKGPIGPRGAISVGATGNTGVTGSTGSTGATGTLPLGDLYGDGTIWPYPSFLYGYQETIISQPATYLTGDTQYDSLTILNGSTLYTNGFRVFVRGTLTNNGAIRNDGHDGLDANIPSTGKGGTGAASNVFRGGGDGGYSDPTDPGPMGGQASFYAWAPSPAGKGGNTPDGVPGGPIFPLTLVQSWAIKNQLMQPVPALNVFIGPPDPATRGALFISGGSGGACSAYNSDNKAKAGAGGGGGVVAINAAVLKGNGVISANGGKSGLNTAGGNPSGGGGGGTIFMRIGFNQSTITYSVAGGICQDINSPGNVNPAYAGTAGSIVFM